MKGKSVYDKVNVTTKIKLPKSNVALFTLGMDFCEDEFPSKYF